MLTVFEAHLGCISERFHDGCPIGAGADALRLSLP